MMRFEARKNVWRKSEGKTAAGGEAPGRTSAKREKKAQELSRDWLNVWCYAVEIS